MTHHEIDDIIARTRTLIHDVVLPLDDEHDGDITAAGGDEVRVTLQAAARAAGVFAPHAPVELGGLGLNLVDRAPVFEEAGYSLFGPLALNIAAPDEGNVHLLDQVAVGSQRDRFLAPLARGQVRSAFAMTEPSPGAGSDPTALATTAVKVDSGWAVSGRKWFITGADGASFYITMARTSGETGDTSGATMFLMPADTEGISVTRHLASLDTSMIGGHCEVLFEDAFVPDEDVLGEVGQGFAGAQVRLGPARMTHVMRWLGAARRAHEVAVAHVAGREAFGARLADLGMVQQMIADNEIDLAATRALLLEACRVLDDGGRAAKETSIAKIFAGEALHRVADRSVQLCGGLGTTHELPVAKIAREIRPFRIYDGPSEVHRWALARRAVREATR
ncbi:acyl-CoA dehydrogenase family protein [Nocardioides carbamazepini]|uniref:acyl-CoA dehydrogenase family protein n=1 Tax=Nocardioides carbamazepini TaxID=2854259 RepID=UPI00214A7E17|nr:acyl-CoA dehydrogenase family protein [Nocardioides carbamazepini]MCR1786322.1 acyl-CoA dehydrogenase family protein [Nocardioides carbamazepini]